VRRHGAFTLIEVLAAVFLTAVVMTIAITFFVDLSDATDAAAAKTRQGRNAMAVLDRLALDLEGAYLRVKAPEEDPLFHPWVFVGEGHHGEVGADRVRFLTRNHRPRNPLDHGSDLALVTWMLEPADGAPGYELLRAARGGLPEPPANEFPSADDDLFMVVAEAVSHFGLRFRNDAGEWLEEWDSLQLEQSGQLPRAVEMEIGFLKEATIEDELGDFGSFDVESNDSPVYKRHVLIPMRPVDIEALLAKAQNREPTSDQDQDQDQDEEFPEDDLQDEAADHVPPGGREEVVSGIAP